MAIDSEIAFAKINLALHVRARRDDGFHEIETIFAFADDGDRLSVEAAEDLRLTIDGPFADGLDAGEGNLVLRAANLMKKCFAIGAGAALTLDKRLPVASGIGGGSADAAATARLLNRFWNIGVSDAELADVMAPLGADIPACVHSRIIAGSGTGTQLHEIGDTALGGTSLLLVNPRKPVSTASIFANWDGIDRGALGEGGHRNDLEPIAIELCPEIADILDLLEDRNPLIARMSGSGATCFALFAKQSERDAAAAAIAEENIAWWTMKAALR